MRIRKTRSTNEAFELLKATRAKLLKAGREVAREQIMREGGPGVGTTYTRKVRAQMVAEGLLDPSVRRDFWLGPLFNKDFTKTGGSLSYTDKARNVHEREIKIWTLKGERP